MSNNFTYVGRDLESMVFANNYHHWILEEFNPYLGKDLVEVGAGTGLFSEMLLKKNPSSISLIEPSEMFHHLKKNTEQARLDSKVKYFQNFFVQVADTISQEPVDSIIYVNVLEHIEDDETELKVAHETLKKGGRCFIFVPALGYLFSKFDKSIGHFRRYEKKELEEKVKKAGFKIVVSKYLDLTGIIPWFIKFKLFNSTNLDVNSVRLYDAAFIPFVKKFESLFKIPVGKNLLLIGEKD